RVPVVPDNSATLGDRPMTIARRMVRDRERMLGMTDEERAWRKKWLDAQKLAPEEPVYPKGYYEQMYNPIRRFYKAPMNKFENMLTPTIGRTPAAITRHLISKVTMAVFALYATYYYMKYNRMDWMRNGGWKITVSRQKMYPDTKDLNVLYRTKGNQFFVNGFDKSPI
ncbi:hypothetical protein ALC62_05530, partial [Cyphomyrmex costatus]